MIGPSHLSGFTGTTQMILLELDAFDAHDMLLLLRECTSSSCPHVLASDAKASTLKLLLEDMWQAVVLLRNLPYTDHLFDTLQRLKTCQIPLEQGNNIFQISQSCSSHKAFR